MLISGDVQRATFLQRLSRFSALAEIEGDKHTAYLPNSGRMRELLTPGRPVFLVERRGSNRKTAFDLVMLDFGGTLVSVDARLPNQIVGEGIESGLLAPFKGYSSIRKEATYGDSRFDLLLEEGPRRCYIEAKSCTLVRDGLALFPDAITARGARHMRGLAEARRSGHGAAVVFVIQRADAVRFSPEDETDPEFGRALREAAKAGVEAYAYRCRVSTREVALDKEIPVCL
ncbi:MAG: DNA/RNA nuclease SfsA [Chloroflexi bacterium]|nr:DNA/RNA nuclease SfsA [Chloroflexota bacterium]